MVFRDPTVLRTLKHLRKGVERRPGSGARKHFWVVKERRECSGGGDPVGERFIRSPAGTNRSKVSVFRWGRLPRGGTSNYTGPKPS